MYETLVTESPDAPSWDGAEYYMGFDERPGAPPIAPSLKEHVAKKFAAESAIMKEKRKARGARTGKK